MKIHKRFHSEGSASGWFSNITAETAEPIEFNKTNTTSNDNGLLKLPFAGEGGGADDESHESFFLPEDHSRDSSMSAATKAKQASRRETMTPDSVAGIVDQVLLSLQRARRQHQEYPVRGIDEEDTVVKATADGLEELMHSLKTYHSKGLSSSDNTALLRRVEDFHRARFLRRQQNPFRPWGVRGLFQFLSDLQLDLEWAEDAAWRRLNDKVYLSWADFQAIHQTTRPPTYFVYAMMFLSTLMLVLSFYLNDWEFAPISVNPCLDRHRMYYSDSGR